MIKKMFAPIKGASTNLSTVVDCSLTLLKFSVLWLPESLFLVSVRFAVSTDSESLESLRIQAGRFPVFSLYICYILRGGLV